MATKVVTATGLKSRDFQMPIDGIPDLPNYWEDFQFYSEIWKRFRARRKHRRQREHAKRPNPLKLAGYVLANIGKQGHIRDSYARKCAISPALISKPIKSSTHLQKMRLSIMRVEKALLLPPSPISFKRNHVTARLRRACSLYVKERGLPSLRAWESQDGLSIFRRIGKTRYECTFSVHMYCGCPQDIACADNFDDEIYTYDD